MVPGMTPKPFTKGFREQFLDRCARVFDQLDETGEAAVSITVTNTIERMIQNPQGNPGDLVPGRLVLEQLQISLAVAVRLDPDQIGAGIPLL